MPEVNVPEPQSETTTTRRDSMPANSVTAKDVPISPALHERLIELGWTPPQAQFDDIEINMANQ